MQIKIHILFIAILSLLYACAADNMVTTEEMRTQAKADTAVANALFDNALDDKASYNISKSGAVVIKFAESVQNKDYTKIVNLLRSNTSITEVYAEQSGQEVCGTP